MPTGIDLSLTPERKAKLVRSKKTGRIIRWKGGHTLATYSKKRNSKHGTRVHIGRQWSAQHSRRPRVGDVVRTKNKDGTYNRQAVWYVYTRYGWRDSGSHSKPSASTIKAICSRARPSRSRR